VKESSARCKRRKRTVYVMKKLDAEEHAAKRFPHKRLKHVGNSLRAQQHQVFSRARRTSSSRASRQA